ncbi:hypothetical protein M422DRAFT_52316 [Sphaerobolus stellatus SS14]|uniref:Uncharacterized protein n=1 Tax=Sphaerobolus stellatus (strain SS14) TaxID=990650 RepID=A0A0C9V8A1_SPHS4|nr:hypothetical protein M422DRAFT_52316 [Sphaerobolus stellatus SS14]
MAPPKQMKAKWELVLQKMRQVGYCKDWNAVSIKVKINKAVDCVEGKVDFGSRTDIGRFIKENPAIVDTLNSHLDSVAAKCREAQTVKDGKKNVTHKKQDAAREAGLKMWNAFCHAQERTALVPTTKTRELSKSPVSSAGKKRSADASLDKENGDNDNSTSDMFVHVHSRKRACRGNDEVHETLSRFEAHQAEQNRMNQEFIKNQQEFGEVLMEELRASRQLAERRQKEQILIYISLIFLTKEQEKKRCGVLRYIPPAPTSSLLLLPMLPLKIPDDLRDRLPWPEKIQRNFERVAMNSTDECDWYGPYNTLLTYTFPSKIPGHQGSFQVSPQYVRDGCSGGSDTLFFIISREHFPCCIVNITPLHHLRAPGHRESAYWQLAKYIRLLYEDEPLNRVRTSWLMASKRWVPTSWPKPSYIEDHAWGRYPRHWWRHKIKTLLGATTFLTLVNTITDVTELYEAIHPIPSLPAQLPLSVQDATKFHIELFDHRMLSPTLTPMEDEGLDVGDLQQLDKLDRRGNLDQAQLFDRTLV